MYKFALSGTQTVHACCGACVPRDRGHWAVKSYALSAIRSGAHGAQSRRGSAPECVFGHSSIHVSRPLAFRARRVRGVLPRGCLYLTCNSCPVPPGVCSAQVPAP